MKPLKYSPTETDQINLDTKTIFEYPNFSENMSVANMVVNGRHPEEENTFTLEHECQFVMYVVKGNGTVYAGDEIFEVKENDVVYVPVKNKFAVEGSLEYITFVNPAFFPEQVEELVI